MYVLRRPYTAFNSSIVTLFLERPITCRLLLKYAIARRHFANDRETRVCGELGRAQSRLQYLISYK